MAESFLHEPEAPLEGVPDAPNFRATAVENNGKPANPSGLVVESEKGDEQIAITADAEEDALPDAQNKVIGSLQSPSAMKPTGGLKELTKISTEGLIVYRDEDNRSISSGRSDQRLLRRRVASVSAGDDDELRVSRGKKVPPKDKTLNNKRRGRGGGNSVLAQLRRKGGLLVLAASSSSSQSVMANSSSSASAGAANSPSSPGGPSKPRSVPYQLAGNYDENEDMESSTTIGQAHQRKQSGGAVRKDRLRFLKKSAQGDLPVQNSAQVAGDSKEVISTLVNQKSSVGVATQERDDIEQPKEEVCSRNNSPDIVQALTSESGRTSDSSGSGKSQRSASGDSVSGGNSSGKLLSQAKRVFFKASSKDTPRILPESRQSPKGDEETPRQPPSSRESVRRRSSDSVRRLVTFSSGSQRPSSPVGESERESVSPLVGPSVEISQREMSDIVESGSDAGKMENKLQQYDNPACEEPLDRVDPTGTPSKVDSHALVLCSGAKTEEHVVVLSADTEAVVKEDEFRGPDICDLKSDALTTQKSTKAGLKVHEVNTMSTEVTAREATEKSTTEDPRVRRPNKRKLDAPPPISSISFPTDFVDDDQSVLSPPCCVEGGIASADNMGTAAATVVDARFRTMLDSEGGNDQLAGKKFQFVGEKSPTSVAFVENGALHTYRHQENLLAHNGESVLRSLQPPSIQLYGSILNAGSKFSKSSSSAKPHDSAGIDGMRVSQYFAYRTLVERQKRKRNERYNQRRKGVAPQPSNQFVFPEEAVAVKDRPQVGQMLRNAVWNASAGHDISSILEGPWSASGDRRLSLSFDLSNCCSVEVCEGDDRVFPFDFDKHALHQRQLVIEQSKLEFVEAEDVKKRAETENSFMECVAAVVVQSFVRRCLARAYTSRRLRSGQLIARTVSSWVETRRQREESEMEIKMYELAAIQIQALYRGWWVRDCITVDNYSATLIQKTLRGYLQRLRFQFDLYRIIVAQSIFRRNVALCGAAHRLANIIRLQSVYRGYRMRKTIRIIVHHANDEENRASAVTMIQTRWRAYTARHAFLKTLSNVRIVQSIARRWITIQLVRHYMMSYVFRTAHQHHRFDNELGADATGIRRGEKSVSGNTTVAPATVTAPWIHPKKDRLGSPLRPRTLTL